MHSFMHPRCINLSYIRFKVKDHRFLNEMNFKSFVLTHIIYRDAETSDADLLANVTLRAYVHVDLYRYHTYAT